MWFRYGDCAWETFGVCRARLPWFSNLRTAATPSLGNECGSLTSKREFAMFKVTPNPPDTDPTSPHEAAERDLDDHLKPEPPHHGHPAHTGHHVHRQPRARYRNSAGPCLRITGFGQCHDHGFGGPSGWTQAQFLPEDFDAPLPDDMLDDFEGTQN
jgi:hypothetical protein